MDETNKTEKDELREIAKRLLKLRDKHLRLSGIYEDAYNNVLVELKE